MTTAPTKRDKRIELSDMIDRLSSGMTIGIGGWGSRRKPMALVRAILNSDLKNLTIVSYGGPDVGLLCAAGKVARVYYGFVSLDSIAYDPWFGKARVDRTIEVREMDEGMLQTGLRAAASRLPFLPMRAGIGSDVLTYYPELRTVTSPYPMSGTDVHEELVAMPALTLDAALVHLNRADRHGNAVYLGPDPYFDDLFCLAAQQRFLSCEAVVETAELTEAAPPQAMLLNRSMVDHVIEAPGGADFTSCVPDYGRDEAWQKAYVTAAGDCEAWPEFYRAYLEGAR
ncbi:MAG: CoA transferase subunit A [Rhodococcus sp. (in: high G+C Gram-positive bacteria)]